MTAGMTDGFVEEEFSTFVDIAPTSTGVGPILPEQDHSIEMLHMLENAWAIIANTDSGSWHELPSQISEWRDAVLTWRDQFFSLRYAVLGQLPAGIIAEDYRTGSTVASFTTAADLALCVMSSSHRVWTELPPAVQDWAAETVGTLADQTDTWRGFDRDLESETSSWDPLL